VPVRKGEYDHECRCQGSQDQHTPDVHRFFVSLGSMGVIVSYFGPDERKNTGRRMPGPG
jgi:hypothetical protein